jgi:hypothetical protein
MSTLCLDDSFAHSWHSLNQLHVTWNAFKLTGVPCSFVEFIFFSMLLSQCCDKVGMVYRRQPYLVKGYIMARTAQISKEI